MNAIKSVKTLFIVIILIMNNTGCKGKNSFPTDIENQSPSEINIQVTLETLGITIKNIFSNINVWDFRDQWTNKANIQSLNYFMTHYPFIQTIQFMTATGGNKKRDLFLNPLDDMTLKDYNFSELLFALHQVVNQGLKPMIKTGAVPLKYSRKPLIGFFGVNIRPPFDYNLYYEYIKSLAGAIVSEFGINEVKTWSWGVLTEFENSDWFKADNENPDTTKIAYFKLYDYTVAALEDVIGKENLIVGAHCMECNPGGLWNELEFIDHVAKGINYKTGRVGTQIDYLAASYYDEFPGRKPAVNLTLKETIGQLQKKAKENNLYGIKFGIDEGRILKGPSDDPRELTARIVGLSFQGASDAKLFQTMNDLSADYFSTWALSTSGIWEGVPLVSTHIANLSYKMSGENRLKLSVNGKTKEPQNEVNGISSYSKINNRLHAMIYNDNANINAHANEQIKILIDNIKPIKGSSVTVKKWVVDDTHANFWPTWEKDMISNGLTNKDFSWSKYSTDLPWNIITERGRNIWHTKENLYKSLAELDSTVSNMSLRGHKLILSDTITSHGVIFYEIENVKFIDKSTLEKFGR